MGGGCAVSIRIYSDQSGHINWLYMVGGPSVANAIIYRHCALLCQVCWASKRFEVLFAKKYVILILIYRRNHISTIFCNFIFVIWLKIQFKGKLTKYDIPKIHWKEKKIHNCFFKSTFSTHKPIIIYPLKNILTKIWMPSFITKISTCNIFFLIIVYQWVVFNIKNLISNCISKLLRNYTFSFEK